MKRIFNQETARPQMGTRRFRIKKGEMLLALR